MSNIETQDGDVLVNVDEGVMLVTLNRPEKMNAMGGSLIADLLAAIGAASEDDDVRALVLTGAGRAFCAGAEVTQDRDPSTGRSTLSRYRRLDHRASSVATAEAFANSDVPIIGAINGPAVGAGFGIAMCCDVRFMGASARLGPIFIKRGLASDFGASYWLPRLVGPARAYEIFYDGGPLPADKALELGVVQRVYPDAQLLGETLAYARKVAAGPPLATTYIRRLVARSLDTPLREFLETEWSWQSNLLKTADAAEGFSAFVERREPHFEGE